MGTDMDLVMAYWKLTESSQHTVTKKWVMGHAYDKKRDNQVSITPMDHAHIECDDDADDCVESGVPAKLFAPLPRYCTVLQIEGNWITTKFRANMRYANTSSNIIKYLRQQLDIDESTFNHINWRATGTVRASYGIARQVRTSKMSYR